MWGIPFGSITTSAELSVGGLLTPLSAAVLDPGGAIPGTPIGGLIRGLSSFEQELAAAIAKTPELRGALASVGGAWKVTIGCRVCAAAVDPNNSHLGPSEA